MQLPSQFAKRPLQIMLVVIVLAGLQAAFGQVFLGTVGEHYRRGRYQEARQALAALELADAGAGEVRLWQQRLAADPAQAGELALQVVRDRSVPAELRLQAGLDGASLALAARRPDEAWRLLQPLLEIPGPQLPGELHLLAGRALHMAGERQRARELLASVKPEDPAFAAARSLLGRIGLESGDHELALRYFESAARRLGPQEHPELLSGCWQALRLLGRDLEARDLAAQLLREHPKSLAALELRELQRREDQEIAAAAADLDQPAPDSPPRITADAGRFTIQLAAFQDRALALQFIARWRAEIHGLRVVLRQDDLEQPLHRIQVGSFNSRVQATTELNRLMRQTGLEGFVTESAE